jgi:hypothetical protein
VWCGRRALVFAAPRFDAKQRCDRHGSGGPTGVPGKSPTAALGAPGDFCGPAALSQPAGRAAVAYLQARAVAAVVPAALAALPAFFVPGSPDIAYETYL